MSGIDVTAALALIADQAEPIAAIGSAVVMVYVGLHAFGWVREALGFGDESQAFGGGDSGDWRDTVADQEFWDKYDSGEAVEGVDFVDVESDRPSYRDFVTDEGLAGLHDEGEFASSEDDDFEFDPADYVPSDDGFSVSSSPPDVAPQPELNLDVKLGSGWK